MITVGEIVIDILLCNSRQRAVASCPVCIYGSIFRQTAALQAWFVATYTTAASLETGLTMQIIRIKTITCNSTIGYINLPGDVSRKLRNRTE